MRCAVCEAENPAGAPECELCGLALGKPVPAETRPDPLPEFEPTVLAGSGLSAQVQPLEVTRSEVEPPPEDTTALWGGPVVDLETGRTADDGARTPLPPEDGACPFCGAISLEVVCDNCGRRKRRVGAASAGDDAEEAGPDDAVLCPACFSHVARGSRCIDCGVPFPPSLQI